jgi:hypothetical protein
MKYLKIVFKILAAVIVIGLIAVAVMAIIQKKGKSEPETTAPETE